MIGICSRGPARRSGSPPPPKPQVPRAWSRADHALFLGHDPDFFDIPPAATTSLLLPLAAIPIAPSGVPLAPGRLDEDSWHVYAVHMGELRFIWDEQKNRTNRKKHGVSFEEAQTAFYDERAQVYPDPDHSETEDRFILLGFSVRLRLLVVCRCYREAETLVRIISARKADRREATAYKG